MVWPAGRFSVEGKSLIPVSMYLNFPGCSVMATVWINPRMQRAVITCNMVFNSCWPILAFVSACRYSFMMQCWELEAEKRPPFSELVQSLSASLESMAGYVPLVGQQRSESEWHESTSPTSLPTHKESQYKATCLTFTCLLQILEHMYISTVTYAKIMPIMLVYA